LNYNFKDDLYNFFKKHSIINDGDVILDVGSNNGQSLILFKSICRNIEVHCFEPFTELCDFVKELIDRNGLKKTIENNIIVSDFIGHQKLYYHNGETDTASLVQDFQENFDDSILLKTVTIDEYINTNNIKHISFIKIDVEGGELEVLKGAINTLTKQQPDLVLELLYTGYQSHLNRQQELIQLIKVLKYNFYLIMSDGTLKFQDSVEPDKTYKNLNYFVTIKNLK